MAVAERIIEGMGGAAPHDVARPARGKTPERKILTTLFVDIVSSSALVAGRDPEDADQILLSILNSLIEAIPRYDGMVSQLLGDGFMAVFGAPNAQEDHALRACLAAQDIVRATVEAADLPDFQVRIGISSGDVVAHVVANGVWADYRTVGECVHLAAKLQQRAEPNSAQLSRDTLDLIPVGVAARPVGSLILAKGAIPMPAFTLEGARAVRRTATDMLRSTNAPFVGRTGEMKTILSLADRARLGAPAILVLSGDAGIGKSRLVGEVLRASRIRDWSIVQWSQMPMRRLGDPDDLEAVALSFALQIIGSTTGDGPNQIVAMVDRRAGALAADAVRNLFGQETINPLWHGLDPAQRLTLSIEGLVAAALELSSGDTRDQTPMLVLVEDAHWASPVMVRFLDALTTALLGNQAHLLLIATRRPPALRLESSPEGWTGTPTARRIDLKTLDMAQVDQFLNHWLGPDWSLADLKTQVSKRSQGVPLYLEEILRTLEATGAITGGPGAYRLVDPAAAQNLPRSLHGLLAARMDLMDQAPRRVLLNAAVIGTTFDVAVLHALTTASTTALSDLLAYLERAGFIIRTRLLPNLEFTFNHALIQEVAYATLTKSDRKALHTRVFNALRSRRVYELPNRIDLLAHHAFLAENWAAAYVCGRKAGKIAEVRSKLEDATRHYRNALEALRTIGPSRENTPRQIELLIGLPRTLLPRGGTDVHDCLNQARDLSEIAGDTIHLAQASSMLASFRWAYGEIDEGVELCQQGLAALDQSDSRETRVQLLFKLSGLLTEKGYFEQSMETLRVGSLLLNDGPPLGNCGLSTLAVVHPPSIAARTLAELGRSAEAIAAGVHAVERAERSGHAFSQIFAMTHMGWSHLILDEIDQSVPSLERALSLSDVARTPILRPLILAGLGYAHVLKKRHSEGFSLFDESFASFRRQAGGRVDGNGERNQFYPRVFLPQVLLWQAQAQWAAGATAQSIQTAQEALGVALSTGQLGYEAHARLFLAKAGHLASAPYTGAQRRLMARRAEALANRLSMPRLAQTCQHVLAHMERSLSTEA